MGLRWPQEGINSHKLSFDLHDLCVMAFEGSHSCPHTCIHLHVFAQTQNKHSWRNHLVDIHVFILAGIHSAFWGLKSCASFSSLKLELRIWQDDSVGKSLKPHLNPQDSLCKERGHSFLAHVFLLTKALGLVTSTTISIVIKK